MTPAIHPRRYLVCVLGLPVPVAEEVLRNKFVSDRQRKWYWSNLGKSGGAKDWRKGKTNGGGKVSPQKIPTPEEARARFDELMAQQKKAKSEVSRTEKMTSRDQDPQTRALHTPEMVQAQHQLRMIYYSATTERMAVEAADPAGYRAARAARADRMNAHAKVNVEFSRELHQAGVTNEDYFNRLTADGVANSGAYAKDAFEYAQKTYPGLTRELYEKAKQINQQGREIRDGDPDLVSRYYYGEPHPPRRIPATGLGPPDRVLGSGVARGGDDGDIQDFMGSAAIAIQIDPTKIAKVASNGRMKNGFEGGASGVGKGKKGYYDVRREAEEQLFGIPREARGEERPIYGYLEHPDRLLSSGRDVGMGYGQAQVVLKPSTKPRTSYTVGDSLDDRILFGNRAGAVSDPPNYKDPEPVGSLRKKSHSVSGMRAGSIAGDWEGNLSGVGPYSPQYIEAQIHGGVRLEDISEIRVPRHKMGAIDAKTRNKLEKAGVKVQEIPPPHTEIHYFRTWDEVLANDP